MDEMYTSIVAAITEHRLAPGTRLRDLYDRYVQTRDAYDAR